jgi:hypothetical protein
LTTSITVSRVRRLRHVADRQHQRERFRPIALARNTEILNLVTVLDALRESYELAKDSRHPELQAQVMQARRLLMDSLQHNLKLQSDLLEMQARLAESEAENEQLRANAEAAIEAHATLRRAFRPS